MNCFQVCMYDKRLSALYELDLKARKLVKLGVSQTW